MDEQSEATFNFAALAASIEEMREVIRAMIAGMEAEGFTPEQSRSIITAIFVQRAEGDG